MEEVFTYRKLSMDYFTIDGVFLRTGLSDKRDWYLLTIRELLDNSIDFLVKFYKGHKDMAIATVISRDNHFFRIKVRNTNPNNIPIFKNKKAIFDFDFEI